MTDLPVACTLSESQRLHREELLARVLSRAEESRLLEEGVALRFPAGDSVLAEVTELIRLERRCCPFLRFLLTLGPGEGPIRLELSGPAGTRAFLEAELGKYL